MRLGTAWFNPYFYVALLGLFVTSFALGRYVHDELLGNFFFCFTALGVIGAISVWINESGSRQRPYALAAAIALSLVAIAPMYLGHLTH